MTIRIAEKSDIETLMKIRLEMLRVVNNLPDDYEYSDEFVRCHREYFENGDQTTVLAENENGEAVGCASISYITVMPTFSHPTGKRAHLMNVYTRAEYRRLGLAKKMIELLIEEAKSCGVTEISLDSTTSGRPLYENLGFTASDCCMTMGI